MEATPNLGNDNSNDNNNPGGACCIPGPLLSNPVVSAPPETDPIAVTPVHR